MNLFKRINYIFDKKQKGQLVVLAVLILIGGVVETLGVSMILPVVSVILNPEALHRNIAKYEFISKFLSAYETYLCDAHLNNRDICC